MSDRQPSEEPEEQVDLEGDDDGMDDDDAGYRRRGSRDDSEEPEEDDDNDERHGDADDDAGMEPEPAGSKGGDDTGKGPDVAGGGPEDEEERSKWDDMLALPPHGSEVFIGGLPRDITEEDLRELCEPLGEIYEVRLTKDKDTKENKGFAFVTFMDKEAAQRAIEDVQDREFKGRTLRCSLSQAKHRLFVGNVPKGLSEEELTNTIKGKGPGVINIEMFKDQHDPNRNRGFLFVEYYNHACADYARQKLSSPNFKVDGSQLTVSWAEPKGSTDASSAAAQAVKGSEKYEIDGQVLEVSMAKPLADKKPDHSHRPGGGPNYPLPPYGGGGYMGDPYGAYGGGGPAYNQPMIYGRGPAPAGMRMVPMVLPDGRLGYVLQQPGGMPPPPPPRRGSDRRDSGRGGEGHSRRYRPY
ncbi:RNA-binding (RRM/RBD/RNP motifs) family protein [Zea mays]|uniref:RNA-binding (RRM/RBD/RNP motifs) family protein n=1 Tax=Zea mays TaxID=4577 RepID=A0A1D6PWZ4_MAIZE|nr:RNA-binding (RRM/RBD/RNP motifs) family protein [Zea mays]AQK51055.1 RNA-binding (RRM/RBD/RNP motifs) family protein [Zea mays]AQK51057.1 RNA-binding (RRM/RBD/RNP motifs) family protein [Zea mays]